MTDLKQQIAEYTEPFEQSLPGFLPDMGSPYGKVAEAMGYSLLSGGKRIRAVLLMASYRLFADDFSKTIPFAAAVEMIHAYSLIHDDLPCMDDDDMRRGKPSCHVAFGEATALLAGDGLQSLAFETISDRTNTQVFGAEKTLEALRVLAGASGADGMVGGQMMDLENENSEASMERLVLTDSKKTGALIAAACEIGCVLGGADEKTKRHIRSYATGIGLAFQIRDDILDVDGDPEKLGKPTGSDSGNKKATYVSLYGIEKAEKIARQLTDEAVGELKSTGLDVEFLCSLARMLAGRRY